MLLAQDAQLIAKYAHHHQFAMNVKIVSILITITSANHAVINARHALIITLAKLAKVAIMFHQKMLLFVSNAQVKDANCVMLTEFAMIA